MKFIKYIGKGYAVLECEEGHRFKFKLRVNEPPFCPVCEGVIDEDEKLRNI